MVVYGNGLNPKFNMKCKFKLECPELDLLVFEVQDKKKLTDKLQYALPISCMN